MTHRTVAFAALLLAVAAGPAIAADAMPNAAPPAPDAMRPGAMMPGVMAPDATGQGMVAGPADGAGGAATMPGDPAGDAAGGAMGGASGMSMPKDGAMPGGKMMMPPSGE